MIPAAFDYTAPDTIDAALALLEKHGDEAKVLAGGHSLIPIMKLRLARPGLVVDLRRVGGALREIKEDQGALAIGAFATHHAIATSALLRQACPLLPEVAVEIGDAQVRNRGTIGGSVAHADPAADWPAALLALEATMVLRSKQGERQVAAIDFFVDLMTTALKPGEILTTILVPKPAPRTGARYQKVHQSASGFALAGVAACLTLGAAGDTVAKARVGITGVAPKPYRARAVESALEGKAATADTIAAAAAHAVDGIADVLADIHAAADYRSQLARVHARRAIERAVANAKGNA
jgi:carbon-monoxide dehydrogenase medium subunit